MRQTLSLRIYQDLYSKIRSHFYKPGEQLPTEVVLSEMYNASLSPVRQALGKLESGQLIVRMPGKGTFVAESMPWENMLAMSGFGVHFIDKKIDSDDVRCPTEECRRKVMPEEVRRLFRTEEGKEWTFLSRVRYVNGQPLFYLNHYFERPGPEEVRDQIAPPVPCAVRRAPGVCVGTGSGGGGGRGAGADPFRAGRLSASENRPAGTGRGIPSRHLRRILCQF